MYYFPQYSVEPELSGCRLLRFSPQQRIKFDPSNSNHREIVKNFLLNGNWAYCCPFYLEDPYTNIRSMVTEKLAMYAVDIKDVL